MKKIYIVDYWVPFPSSEYGGLINVIAKDDNECHDILLEWRDKCESDHDSQIMDKVKKALKFYLQDELESGIIDSFTT